MEKNFEVSEQNFTEGEAVHYLCNVQDWFSWLRKKMKRSGGIELF